MKMDNHEGETPLKRPKKKFLSVPEVADELGVSARHVWRLIEGQELKPHHFGGATRVGRDDLDDYIRRSRG